MSDNMVVQRDSGWFVKIVQRRGGWFVTGVDWSGPWATKKAAELASSGEYTLAHEEERKSRKEPQHD